MFEKFTERARRAMSLARQEAQRLNQEFIGGEHILLGILQGGEGVAVGALKALQADPTRIRQEIEKRLTPSVVSSPIQPPFSPRCKRAIELAGEAASLLGHGVIGTQHLLLGLLREKEGVAAQALLALGLEDGPLLAKILAIQEHDPSPRASEPPARQDWSLAEWARNSRPLVDRPSVQEPLAALLQQGRSIALVGAKRVGKTSIVMALCRSKAANFTYWSLDHRVFDEFARGDLSQSTRPGTVCLIPQAELLTASRSANANLLEDRLKASERLILEFRDGDLEQFSARYPLIAKPLVTVDVKPPTAEECRQLLDGARARLKEKEGLDVPDDVLQEADQLARDRWRHLVPPWPTITTLWTAELIHRETSARGDEQQLLKDIADFEKSGDAASRDQADLLKRHLEGLRSILGSSALSMESVRRAIGELSGQDPDDLR